MTLQQLRQSISEHYCVDEIAYLEALRKGLQRSPQALQSITDQAIRFCESALEHQSEDAMQSLLQEFNLSSEEGVALMALTEALLRIPDQDVATQLIADRIEALDWEAHLNEHNSSFINASTFLLMLTGKVLTSTEESALEGTIHKLVRRISQPVIHKAMTRVISVLASQYVFAESAQQATESVTTHTNSHDCFSLDMLGEGAVCEEDANNYLASYLLAIRCIGEANLAGRSSISIKLSALHARYEYRHETACLNDLYKRLSEVIEQANKYGIDLTLDAEEAARLELGLDLFAKLFSEVHGDQPSNLGLAVQAYGKRALPTLEYLKQLAETTGRKIAVRLVKGAYWDSEIKQAQLEGLDDYPVYTHKHHTDIAYLACAEFLLANRHCFYPQFATHNAVTICDIMHQAEPDSSYEFQRLHGMGEAIYDSVRELYPELKVRIYGPVGKHRTLLPYLVRRMLENGANSAFLKQLQSHQLIARVCRHPLARETSYETVIPLPKDIYMPVRENSRGVNLANQTERMGCLSELAQRKEHIWKDELLVTTTNDVPVIREVCSPYDGSLVGTIHELNSQDALASLELAHHAFTVWRTKSVHYRANLLRRLATELEQSRYDLVSLLVREAGKTIPDAFNELREAIDFAYYYANSAESLAGQAIKLPHIEGEQNHLFLRGRGVFLCISPWNFPLAIFVGQICAALVAGNTVLAKPAEQTPLIGRLVVSLFRRAGLLDDELSLLPGNGQEIGSALCIDNRLAGVAFTGSTQTAKRILVTLSQREGAMIPFIAETGGQNAMIVDSSALPEQVVKDVIHSAFYSAGQRCSALRVLYLQEDIADAILSLLKGAMAPLSLGDPAALSTDIGPIISASAKHKLEKHCHVLEANGRLIFKLNNVDPTSNLLAPHVFHIESIDDLTQEHFGPILHVIRYKRSDIGQVIQQINDHGFGLTCGIQSRNERWAKHLASQLHVGNIYINRDMVGATVGSQPFGGQGLSGTGFKAGGPYYLLKFMTESTLTTNLSAIGGNVDLMARIKN